MLEATTCVIAGGGPAGMVLGLLLARAGVEVTLLEKHADFLRDFRGDTVHPSTLRLLDDLGLWDEFSRVPQSRIDHLGFDSNGRQVNQQSFRLNGTSSATSLPAPARSGVYYVTLSNGAYTETTKVFIAR